MLPNNIDVAVTPVIGPGYTNANLDILSTVDDASATLEGTVYVQGNLNVGKTNQDFTLDLGGKTLFAEGDIDIGGKTTITGSGCIIAIGDVNFMPNIDGNPDEFMFVMSVGGGVNFQPNGDFYGSIAGTQDKKVEINLQPGSTITYTFPEDLGDIDFPGPGSGGGSIPSSVRIRTWSVIPPMTAANIPLSIITDSPLPEGQVGVDYSQSLTTMGGTAPYTWLHTGGSLPGGLSLDASGAITGMPDIDGTFDFTVQVTDSASPTPDTATKTLSITITMPPEV